jgi:hypothetical protein
MHHQADQKQKTIEHCQNLQNFPMLNHLALGPLAFSDLEETRAGIQSF